jgi:Rod binding domain-containing protein
MATAGEKAPTSAVAGRDVGPAERREAHALEQAARDFEAVFLRQMLSSLERTTRVSSKGNAPSGQQAYGSMIVDAVADAVAKAGGLGVADMLAAALAERTHVASPTNIKENATTDLGTKPGNSPGGTKSATEPLSLSEDVRISPQGSSRVAVPRSEIRASAPPIKGPLADRRIP